MQCFAVLLLIVFLAAPSHCQSFWDYTDNHTFSCQQTASLNTNDLWHMMIMHALDKWWLLVGGSIVLLLLVLLLFSFCIPGSLTQPVDILLAMFVFEVIVVGSMVSQAAYFTAYDPDSQDAPDNFDAFCQASGLLNILGVSGLNIYNVMFCLMLAISVRNTLKGSFFNKRYYHWIGFVLAVGVTLGVFGLGMSGKELSGICGFKYSSVSPFLFLIMAVVVIIIAIVSTVLFRKAIPDNSFFRAQVVYRYYYYYISFVAALEFLISLGYVVGAANCLQDHPNPLVNITMSISNCMVVIRAALLCMLRLTHPAVRIYFQDLFKPKPISEDLDPLEELELTEPEYNWLGSLLESIRASQVLSFLSGMLISYVQFYPRRIERLKAVDFHSHYTFSIDEQTANNYLQKRRSKRQSYRVNRQLGGLKPLNYEVTSYCPRVFTFWLQQYQPGIKLQHSLNIQSNNQIIKNISEISGGKSGQFFFFSHDQVILFKTISKQECESYLKKLRSFDEHYRQNEKSLIVRVLGLYRFRRRDLNGEESYMILQKNLAACDRLYLERVFDLKGSRYNREKLAQVKITDLSTTTLMDVDFLKTEKKIHISHFISQGIRKTLRRDIEFLRVMGVMDYSLLVMKVNWKMIAFSKQRPLSEVFPKNSNYLQKVASETEQGIYYHFGIIDYLQEWSVVKRTERFIKKMVTREFKNSIVTAEEPQVYSSRLIEFIQTIFP